VFGAGAVGAAGDAVPGAGAGVAGRCTCAVSCGAFGSVPVFGDSRMAAIKMMAVTAGRRSQERIQAPGVFPLN
jgi:hypothetical protein